MPLPVHQRFLQRAYLLYGKLQRGMTLGVRAMLLRDGAVILVKHSYVNGWYLPGGGIDPGESAIEALRREVREEVGATLNAPVELFGLYRNRHVDSRDHVALYVCRSFERGAALPPNREIVACETFPLDRLPSDLNSGTARRIDEVIGGRPPTADW